MRTSFKIGLRFGVSSAIITIMGLMVGLNAGTHSKMVVLGAILTIAIADSLSDALGVHISEESEKRHSNKHVWEATIATVVSKFLVAITFTIPLFFLSLNTAIIIGIIWGTALMTLVSYRIAKERKMHPMGPILEHLVIAFIVIVLTYLVGTWVGTAFA